jgi:hypothetical protein
MFCRGVWTQFTFCSFDRGRQKVPIRCAEAYWKNKTLVPKPSAKSAVAQERFSRGSSAHFMALFSLVTMFIHRLTISASAGRVTGRTSPSVSYSINGHVFDVPLAIEVVEQVEDYIGL